MAYIGKNTWVDDDGSGNVGTLINASRLNNLEDGVVAGQHLSGTLAAMTGAVATANPGALYFATDDNNGTLYRAASGAWTKVTLRPLSGTLAARTDALAVANPSALYLATDDNGGTLYRSNGTTWVQCAPGVSQAGGGGGGGITAGNWTAITFASATNWDATNFTSFAYRQYSDGIVQLRGIIRITSSSTSTFAITATSAVPAPVKKTAIMAGGTTDSNSSGMRIADFEVRTDGAIYYLPYAIGNNTSTNWWSFEGLRYSAT